MEKFVNKTIDSEEFKDSLMTLRQILTDKTQSFIKELDWEKLKNFQPDPRLDGFGSLISFLRAGCDNFTENYQNEEFYKKLFFKTTKSFEWRVRNFLTLLNYFI